jgi:hypothetical protein
LELRVDHEAWQNWAVNHKIHKDVVGYVGFAKQDLYDFDPRSSSRSFATPRTWTFVSELIDDKLSDAELTDLVAGTVGEGVAIKFMAHRKIAGKMPKPSDILSGKVSELQVKEISAMYSLTIAMCYELKESAQKLENKPNAEWHSMADNFFKFMMDNFTQELTVMGARIALTTYDLPIVPGKLKNFDEFHKRYGKYIVAAAQR